MIKANVLYSITILLLWLWSPSTHSADLHDNKTVAISLAMSGGISPGTYEAGLNWVIGRQLKLMRQPPKQRADKYPAEPAAITGTSAGGINARVTAMSGCMNDHLMQCKAGDTVYDKLNTWKGCLPMPVSSEYVVVPAGRLPGSRIRGWWATSRPCDLDYGIHPCIPPIGPAALFKNRSRRFLSGNLPAGITLDLIIHFLFEWYSFHVTY